MTDIVERLRARQGHGWNQSGPANDYTDRLALEAAATIELLRRHVEQLRAEVQKYREDWLGIEEDS